MNPEDRIASLGAEDRAIFESCVERFEQACHDRLEPEIEEFLPDEPPLRELLRNELTILAAEFRENPFVLESEDVAKSWNVNTNRIELALGTPWKRFEGGHGDVLVFYQASLKRNIAIKQLRSAFREDIRIRASFEREAYITSQLEHPGIVPVFGHGLIDNGLPFYAMRFVEGHTFAERLQIRNKSFEDTKGMPLGKGSLQGKSSEEQNWRSLIMHFHSVCKTIEYAHSKGIIHRDLKPNNIVIGEYGETVVLDWGLATQLHSDSKEVGQQESPLTIGSPAYMSPEQASGMVSEIDHQTDVFGLGAILYSILTKEIPFQGATVRETMRLAQANSYAPPLQVNAKAPPELAAICERAMANKKVDRYATVKALSEDIERWLAGEPVSVYPEGILKKLARLASKRRTLAASLALVCLLALSATAWLTHRASLHAENAKWAVQLAEQKEASNKRLLLFLSKTFESADPIRMEESGFVEKTDRDARETLLRILENGFQLIQTEKPTDSTDLQGILMAMATSFRGLGLYSQARQAIELLPVKASQTAIERGDRLLATARLENDMGEYDLAKKLYLDAIQAFQESSPVDERRVASAKYHLAWLFFYQPLGVDLPQFQPENVKQAIDLFSEVIEIRERLLPENDRAIGMAYAGLASAELSEQSKFQQATFHSGRALSIMRQTSQEHRTGDFIVEYQLAELLRQQGRSDEAERLYIKLRDQIVEGLGTKHPIYLLHLWNMAGHYRKFDQIQKVKPVVQMARQTAREMPNLRSAPFHVDALVQCTEYLIQKNSEEAKEFWEEAFQLASERPDVNARSIEKLNGFKAQVESIIGEATAN